MTRSAVRVLWGLAALLLAALAIELAPGLTPAGVVLRGAAPPGQTAAPSPISAPSAGTPGAVFEAGADRTAEFAAVILARPLFNASRRPVAAAAAPGAAPAADLPRLAGLVVTPAGRYAIFSGAGGARPVVVTEGGRIGDYAIGRIDQDGVAVTGPGGERRLRPSFAPGAPAPGTAAAAPPLDASPTGLSLIRNPPNIPIPAAPKR